MGRRQCLRPPGGALPSSILACQQLTLRMRHHSRKFALYVLFRAEDPHPDGSEIGFMLESWSSIRIRKRSFFRPNLRCSYRFKDLNKYVFTLLEWTSISSRTNKCEVMQLICLLKSMSGAKSGSRSDPKIIFPNPRHCFPKIINKSGKMQNVVFIEIHQGRTQVELPVYWSDRPGSTFLSKSSKCS
jgi:hypothetical protein